MYQEFIGLRVWVHQDDLLSAPLNFSYIIFDLLIWIILARRINAWRESVLGLKSTTFSQLRLDQVPFLYNFSPLVVPRPNDWQPWVNATGYWFLDSPEANDSTEKPPETSIPEDLRKVIHQAKESGRKIVYVGFGSVRRVYFLGFLITAFNAKGTEKNYGKLDR